MFLAFATMVSLVWSSVHSSPMNYTLALSGSETFTGGRYLYPVLMAWLVAGVVLLLRTLPGEPGDLNEKENMTVHGTNKSCGEKPPSR